MRNERDGGREEEGISSPLERDINADDDFVVAAVMRAFGIVLFFGF